MSFKKIFFSGVPRALVLCGLLLSSLLLGGCGSKVNISEDEVVARAKQELALLNPIMRVSAASIKADLNNCGVIYENVVIRLPEMPEMQVRVAEIVMRGMDIPSYEGNPGAMTEIENIRYSDIKFDLEGTQVAGLESYEISGLRLPYRDLIATLQAAQGLSAEHFVIKLLPYCYNYETRRALAKDFTFSYSMVQIGIDKMEALETRYGSYGPSSMTNLKGSFMGRRIVSLDRMACEGVSLPQVILDMLADPENYARNHPDLEERLAADPLGMLAPLEIRGITLDNLYLNPGSAPLTLKKFTGDFRINEDKMTIKSGVQDLTLTRALLSQFGELVPVLDVIKKDLVLSGDFNMGLEIPAEANHSEIYLQTSLKEAKLGGGDLDIAMIGPREILTDPEQRELPPLLKSASLSLENNGLIDLIINCAAATEYPPAGFEETYNRLINALKQRQSQAETPMQRETLAKLVRLVEEGGKISLNIKPPQPVYMEALSQLNEEELLRQGLTLDYTPPAKPLQR